MGFDTVGVLLAASAAVTYTVYILVADTVLDRLPPVPLTALVMTGAAMALGLRSVLTGGVDLSFAGSGWFWVACIVVVSTVLAVLAFFAGLRRTGASTTSILSTFEPVVSTVLAAVVLGQVLAPVQAIGALLVLGAAVIVHLRPSSTPTVDAPAAQSPSCAQADAPRARAATGDQWDGDGPGRFARRG